MVAFYKRDIAKWMDATEKLSHGAYRAYDVVLSLIYLHEGPIAFNERGLAGRCNMTVRAFIKAIDELRQAGKLTLENGKISNARAEKELVSIENHRDIARIGGINSGKSRGRTSKSLKSNEPLEVPLQDPSNIRDKTRLDKNRDSSLRSDEREKAFEEFWLAYPRRDGENPKAPARKRFDALVKSGIDPKVIIAGIQRAAAAHKDKIGTQYIPQARTWLSERRFEQYADDAKGGHVNGGQPCQADLERTWAGLLEYEARHGTWSSTRIQRASIPAEFIARWQRERTTEKPEPELKLTA